MGAKRDEPEVFRISGAPVPLSQDVDQRARRYLISMSIRTVCFLGCVVAWVAFDQVIVAAVLLAASLFLPYFAVVVANAGRERVVGPPRTTLSQRRDQLGSGDGPNTSGT